MRNLRNFFLIALVMLMVALAATTAEAQNGDEERFPNGFVIKGEFLRFYRSAPDPWLLFGYPISNELNMAGHPVQYFDRARFELETTDKGPVVKLANLGYILYDETKTIPSDVPSTSLTCRYFPKFGHSVCYKFLQFYDAYNGPLYFGEPRSEAIISNGQTVQYFDNARLVWRTNLGPDLAIGLTDVGWLAMQKYYGVTTKPGPSIHSRQLVAALEFQARAFVSQALVAPDSGNTVFVLVRTLDLKPVKGAVVNLSVTLAAGKTTFPSQLTDADGVVQISIPALAVGAKQIVPIQVSVEYKGKSITTSTWYRVWY